VFHEKCLLFYWNEIVFPTKDTAWVVSIDPKTWIAVWREKFEIDNKLVTARRTLFVSCERATIDNNRQFTLVTTCLSLSVVRHQRRGYGYGRGKLTRHTSLLSIVYDPDCEDRHHPRLTLGKLAIKSCPKRVLISIFRFISECFGSISSIIHSS